MTVSDVAAFYQHLSKDNLHELANIYHQEIVFEDAAHRIEGLNAFQSYFENLYANVIRCDFTISEHHQTQNTGFLVWVMELQHSKLNQGATVSVHGTSHIRIFSDKVIYQRDYFDLGEMLYEQVPLLGTVIKGIKGRLGQ